MELQRYRYEDTEKNANLPKNKDVRAIGVSSSMECHILQLKDNLPKEVGGIIWMAMANAEHSVYLPFYGNINDTFPAYKIADDTYTPESFYWTMRDLNVKSALNREKYGKNVRAYWNSYEQQLLQTQADRDQHLIQTYKKSGKDAAADYATKIGIEISKDAFTKATQITKELTTYIFGDDAKPKKSDFAPSFMKVEKKK